MPGSSSTTSSTSSTSQQGSTTDMTENPSTTSDLSELFWFVTHISVKMTFGWNLCFFQIHQYIISWYIQIYIFIPGVMLLLRMLSFSKNFYWGFLVTWCFGSRWFGIQGLPLSNKTRWWNFKDLLNFWTCAYFSNGLVQPPTSAKCRAHFRGSKNQNHKP